jgi:esterase
MKLYFRQYGSGSPVIILHGLFGQSDNWITIAQRMANHYSVYLPDLRNHGQSPHSPLLSYPLMTGDLLGLLEDQQLVDPILVGHSMGGKVAMTFALEYPEKVKKLVVVDISPRKYPDRKIHSKVMAKMLALNLEAFKTRTEVQNYLQDDIADERIRMLILKNLNYKSGKLAWRLNLEAIANSMDFLFDKIESKNVFTKPTLFIKGGNSDYLGDSDEVLIHNFFPEAAIIEIPGASHWVHSDAPGEICKVLGAFLGNECSFP